MEAAASPAEHGFLGDRRWRPTIYYEQVFWRCPCAGCTFTLRRGSDPPPRPADIWYHCRNCSKMLPEHAEIMDVERKQMKERQRRREHRELAATAAGRDPSPRDFPALQSRVARAIFKEFD